MKTILLSGIVLLVFFACKKDKDNDPPQPAGTYRIKSTTQGSDKKTFHYDADNRVDRINFNGGSYRFTYSNTEINAQTYFEDGSPDPGWKYRFAINNNKIVNGFRYQTNGAISRDYTYGYDNETGNLVLAATRIFDFTGDVSEAHNYRFTYNADNNLETVNYLKRQKSGNKMQQSDSAAITLTYYTDKNFVTQKQMGFDFFGKRAGGIQLTGLETMPFSLLFQERIIPSEKAIQSIVTKKYSWNPGSNTWSVPLTGNQSFPGSDYTFNNNGLPVKYKNVTIEWETYE